ncbi:F-box/LRR-repeat protein 7-like [Drosophila tropicalis]|uniref:F-box/LRR-repeat protein 7-like n=1 Tax=Drosophila tropicalis TaxID=46794 RepID=UPI0035AB980F
MADNFIIKDLNCYEKNGLFFTKDHMTVQKLFLYNIPETLEKEDLIQLFSQIGSVLSVAIYGKFQGFELPELLSKQLPCYNGRIYSVPKANLNIGCVLFGSPSDAAKALKIAYGIGIGHGIGIFASDSWNQPDINEDPETQEEEEEEAHILKIPDDCLLKIIGYLPLGDRLHFQRTCKRFRTVYEVNTRALHKSVDFDIFQGLTLWNIRDFFRLSGPYIDNFTAFSLQRSIPNERIIKYMGRGCTNMTTLELSDVTLSTRNVFQIVSTANKLENLTLIRCDLTDDKLIALKDLKNLKKINLRHNPFMGYYLVKLPVTIQNLDVSYCYNLNSSYLHATCKMLTNLTQLHIFNIKVDFPGNYRCLSLELLRLFIKEETQCEQIAKLPKLKDFHIGIISQDNRHTKIFDYLAIYKSDQLEKLVIYCCEGLSKKMVRQIAKLSGLKTLILGFSMYIDDNDIDTLASLTNLECLALGGCLSITNNSMLRMIYQCHKLQDVHLKRCSNITENLIHNIVRYVSKSFKKHERILPINLYLYDTKIKIQNSSLDAGAQGIINIIYKTQTYWDSELI